MVEDGAITGSQDIPGNGGIFITDEKFGDFEIILEMNNDLGRTAACFCVGPRMGRPTRR